MAISLLELTLRLVASVLLGGAIGFERERREQPAGLRTHLLVSLASATFTVASTQFVFYQQYPNDGSVRTDVGRIASNVVVGIGFLGGGAILRSGLQIKGLTTAASLWMVAAVGLASGAGMFALATLAALLSLFALIGLRYLEQSLRSTMHLRVHLTLEGDFLTRAQLDRILSTLQAEVKQTTYSVNRIRDRSSVWFEVVLPRRDLEEPMLKILEGLPSVRTVTVHQSGA